MMRFRLMIALVVAAACGGGGSDSPTAPGIPSTPANPIATNAVSLQNNTFSPSNIVVSPSSVVTFSNTDGITHNVIFGNQSITAISEWTSGDRTATMPAAPGTYSYTCTVHAGMSGTVKVQ
jgi:plastocyanin